MAKTPDPSRSSDKTAAATQLVLVTPPLDGTDAIAARLAEALSAGPVAAVIVRVGEGDERSLTNRVKALAPAIQEKGAALMVAGPLDAVARGGADGLHLAYAPDPLAEAMQRLSPQRMVGVGALRSRDEAMAAGEAGADYVMFGEPFRAKGDEIDRWPPFAGIVDRVAWWADLFQVPVVGFAPDLDGVAALAAVRADFVALGPELWAGERVDTRALVTAALAALAAGPGPRQ